jgi:hypothetical protein
MDVSIELKSTQPPSSRLRSIRKRKFAKHEEPVLMVPQTSDSEGPFWFSTDGPSSITRREHQLLKEIVHLFTPDILKTVVIPLNDEKSKSPRLRAFDWAVTNFAKGNPLTFVVNGTILDPNVDYQSALKKHHRLLFDPFRRGTHIFFEDQQGITHMTTVGQLSFIKWCIDHKIDKYVEDNLLEIRKHMSEAAKSRIGKRRRKELTKSPRNLVRGIICEDLEV